MYDYIQGEVTELTPAYAVVEAGGVGYYLVISLQTYAELEHLSSARVYTHFAVREDAQTLYGFATREEREVFRLLVSAGEPVPVLPSPAALSFSSTMIFWAVFRPSPLTFLSSTAFSVARMLASSAGE